jgi:hypothetical protein
LDETEEIVATTDKAIDNITSTQMSMAIIITGRNSGMGFPK